MARRLMGGGSSVGGGAPPGTLRRFESCYTLSRREEMDNFTRSNSSGKGKDVPSSDL